MNKGKTPVKTNGKRNRNAGKKWEHDIIRMLRESGLYPNAVSTRSESRSLDGYGIDVMNKNERINGIMHDSIQAKTETRMVHYAKLLDRIRSAGRPNPVIFHRQTVKSGSKFMARDKFAICYLDTYMELLRARQILKAIVSHLHHLPEAERIKITSELEKLGL